MSSSSIVSSGGQALANSLFSGSSDSSGDSSGNWSLTSSSGHNHGLDHGHAHQLSTVEIVTFSLISFFLTLGAGILSGLILALFSIDAVHLKVESRTGDKKASHRAKRLLALIDRHHLTLVALLISTAACMTALPIFLEELLDPLPAVIVSVGGVLLAEVLCESMFVKHAVPVCYFLHPLVWLTMVITFLVAWPFAKLLDFVVGHKSDGVMEREQLGEFFRIHGDDPNATGDGGGDDLMAIGGVGVALSKSEVAVMQGALKMSIETVEDILKVRTQDCFMLSSAAALDKETIKLILEKGYSRIPIFKEHNRKHILGCLLVKSLLPLAFKSPNPPPRCGEYPLSEVVRASNDWLVEDLYAAFQECQTHMAVVYNRRGRMEGIITLEDVFEMLHSIEMEDEHDHADSWVRLSNGPISKSGDGNSGTFFGSPAPREKRLLEVYSAARNRSSGPQSMSPHNGHGSPDEHTPLPRDRGDF